MIGVSVARRAAAGFARLRVSLAGCEFAVRIFRDSSDFFCVAQDFVAGIGRQFVCGFSVVGMAHYFPNLTALNELPR